MSEVVGFGLALLIGVTLGMLGGGGSILTVPVLVYVMGFEPKLGIAMSLPVVGASSVVGAIGHWRSGNLDWRVVAAVAPLAMAGAVGGARLALLVSARFQLILLAGVMAAAGLVMLRDRGRDEAASGSGGERRVALATTGLGVGVLTGLVGVGGGFLIVPALVLLARIPMKRAVGTSLVVISLSTLTGLAAYQGQAAIRWRVVALFTALTMTGAGIGAKAARRVPARALRRAFAVLVLMLSAFLAYESVAAGAPARAPAAKPS